MATRASSRLWWDAFITNVKNQGPLVIDKLKEVIDKMDEQSTARFVWWIRSELAKDCWREHLHGALSPFESFDVASPAAEGADFSSSSSSSAADHRGGSVLPPGPGDIEVLHLQRTARLAAWGGDVLEKMKREQDVESLFASEDHFVDTEPTTHDDASSAEHFVGLILPQVDLALKSARFAAWSHSAWARAAAADEDNQGRWMKPRIGPVLACDCEPNLFDSEPAPPTPPPSPTPTTARPPRPLPPASPPPPSTAARPSTPPPPPPASPPPPPTPTPTRESPPPPKATYTSASPSPPPPPTSSPTVRPPPPLPRATVTPTPTPTPPPPPSTATSTRKWVGYGGAVVLSAGVVVFLVKLAYDYIAGGNN